MLWHDGSSLSNHSHILMTVASLYNPAFYLTDSEFESTYGYKCNVQAVVEAPYIYIIARCLSNDQQLMYSGERINDILNLKCSNLCHGNIEIKDVVCVFKGDDPAGQFKAGQQKGGHYPCWSCQIRSSQTDEIDHSLNLPYTSIKNRNEVVLATFDSQNRIRNGTVKLFSNLCKADLISELHQRKAI